MIVEGLTKDTIARLVPEMRAASEILEGTAVYTGQTVYRAVRDGRHHIIVVNATGDGFAITGGDSRTAPTCREQIDAIDRWLTGEAGLVLRGTEK